MLDPEAVIESWWHDQFAALANADLVSSDTEHGAGYTRLVAGTVQAFIALEGLIDLDAERQRISKALESAQKDFDRAQGKLGNEKFRANAPDEVIAKEESKAAELSELIANLTRQLSEL